MNHFKYLGIIALSGLALAGCGEDAFVHTGDGQGTLRVVVDVNQSLLTSRSARATTGDDGVVSINANDLMLQLTSDDGSWSKSWDNLDDLNSNGSVPSGTYTMEAFYGHSESHGFESPYFYGSTELTVKTGETTEAGLSVSLANSLMTISFGADMVKYLTDYSAELQCAGVTETIKYVKDETRSAYVIPGQVSVYVNVTKPNGKSRRLLAGTVDVEARHHYFVTINMSESGESVVGDGRLVVTFDEALETEVYAVDLSDELIEIPAPQVTAVGFIENQVIKNDMYRPYNQDLRFDIFTPGQLDKVILKTTNASVISAEWPEEVDLMNATKLETLKRLGLVTRGFGATSEGFASIDFAQLLSKITIPAGNDEASVVFSVTAVDNKGKESDPSPNLSVRILPNFSINVFDSWATKAYFVVYDKADDTESIKYTEGVTAEISANNGSFKPVSVELQDDNSWLIVGLEPNTNYSLRISHDDIRQEPVNLITEAAPQLPNSNMEEWHTEAGQTEYWWVEYPWANGDSNHAWDTLNKLTTSEGGTNTRLVSNHDGCSYCAYSGTRATTDSPSGEGKAAIIETLGWGSGNTAAGTNASFVNNITAGELYLGHYDASAGGANYGYTFESRPMALEFYYKYSPKNTADYGTAIMDVLDENGEVIGTTGLVALNHQGAYTLKRVPIIYTNLHAKAKQVKVVFKSTVGNDGTHNFLDKNNSNINWASVSNDSRHTGSALYIDDINLVY